MTSLKTSPNKRPFGKTEIDYLTRIEAAMQNPVQISTVRMWLEKAQAEGIDPRRLYEAAVAARPPHWTPAPPFSDVISTTSEMLTPSELEDLQRVSRENVVYLQKAYPKVTILE